MMTVLELEGQTFSPWAFRLKFVVSVKLPCFCFTTAGISLSNSPRPWEQKCSSKMDRRMCVDRCEVISDPDCFSLSIYLAFFLLHPVTLTHVLYLMNLTPHFFIFVWNSKISSEYIIKKRRMKGCYITIAKSNCVNRNRFGYSSKLTRLLLRTTKRLFQLFLKYVKTV